MPDSNRISATLTAEDRTTVLASLATIKKALPFLLSLSPKESREMPRLGPKGLGFDESCASFMNSHPALVPAFVDLAEVGKDRVLRTELSGIVRELNSLAESATDTLAVISHEIYMADLAFYQNTRQAAKHGILDAQTVFDTLSTRFPGRPAAATRAMPATS
jgi:predicted oxidoreductase